MALTDLAKDQRLGGTGLIMGGINFGWLAVWVPSPNSVTGRGSTQRRPVRANIIALLLDILNGDSPFAQPQLKVVEV
jgi:hypothetical protein